MKIYKNLFEKITSLENLFEAWDKFKKGKRHKNDVQIFEYSLEENIFKLHRKLCSKTYYHLPYSGFFICDPKVRHIHKATVRDRIIHHAIFKILNPIFDATFIPHSFSCRINKGVHKGVLALERMVRAESRNFTRPCFILKCDVQKFFDSVDHQILLNMLKKKIVDPDTMWLLGHIVGSYTASQINLFDRQGLPIGNLTSQLFANVYMNQFDQFVKHTLHIRHYARYTDDFVIASTDKEYLKELVASIRQFLNIELRLNLHPNKVSIVPFHRGVDFLGYIAFPHYRLLRKKTKLRLYRKLRKRIVAYRNGKISEDSLSQSLQSYLGVLSHANAYNLTEDLKNQYWFWLHE
ncbi:reverse transcriptase domain-containing protein [Patescibacteria group bacterium]